MTKVKNDDKKSDNRGKSQMKNKKGWLNIVESFVAILLVTVVFLVMFEKNRLSNDDISNRVYETENNILGGIQINDSLREDIISMGNESLPLEYQYFPADLKHEINSSIPSYLECEGKICILNENCELSNEQEKSVYAKSTIISSTMQEYSPRQLKIFCWEK